MSPYKRNIVTGVVVMAAMLILAWMSLTFSGRLMGLFKPRGTPVSFFCTRADGLNDGSPVTYNGVQCGKVTSVVRSPDNLHITIGGEIDNPPLPENVIGLIKASSYLGSAAQIDLSLEGAPVGHLTSDSPPIKLTYVGTGIIPPELTSMMKDVRQQKLLEHVDAAIVTLKAQLENAGRFMDNANKLIGDTKMQDDFRASIASIRTTTERAAKISADLETLTKTATTTMTDAQATVAKANTSIDTVTLQMTGDLDKIGGVLHQVQDMTEKLNRGKGSAGLLLNDPKLYDEMAGTAKELHILSETLVRLSDQWEHEGVALKLQK